MTLMRTYSTLPWCCTFAAIALLAVGSDVRAQPAQLARSSAGEERSKDPRPNIIIIVADDLGYADVGIQGCKDVPTPNIDSIARKGIRFTAGYVQPWCAPTRHSLITACWPGKKGFAIGKQTAPVNLIELFARAGYFTAIYGKVHGHDTKGFQDALYFSSGNYRGLDGKSGRPTPLTHNGKEFPFDEYLTDLLTRFAVKAIGNQRQRPFLLYLPYQAVKIPIPPTKALLERAGKLPGNRSGLAATMIGLDDGVGRILAALKEHQLDQNTIVFFVSDNGGGDSNSLNTPLRGKKAGTYEGGVRVPFLMSWPAGLKAGLVYDRPVSIADVLITSLAAAKIEGPDPSTMDGVNLLPYLKGDTKGDPHRYLFWDPSVAIPARTETSSAVRSGPWKAVLNRKSNAWELYEIEKDISEMRDVAAEHPMVVRELTAALERWQKTGRP